jgi:hypothetical protein
MLEVPAFASIQPAAILALAGREERVRQGPAGLDSGARTHRVNPVEERSREVEDRSKDSGTHRGQVPEENQGAGQGQYEDEPEEDMKEELTIRPAGVVARLGPPLLSEIEATIS